MPAPLILIQLADELVQVGRVLSCGGGLVAELLSLGAFLDPPLLVRGGRVGFDVGLVLEVPALPALGGAQRPAPLCTRQADRRQGVPAGGRARCRSGRNRQQPET